jgi:DNA-binding HxlR family transcriptional regulator
VSGYGQFCPVAKGAELFAERWTPLIIRELVCGSRRFGEIRSGCPRIPRSLLTHRLRSLERAGVVERRAAGRAFEYHLTASGAELGAAVEALGAWGYRWATAELSDDDLDPAALMWFWRSHLRREGAPADRMVIEVEFTDARRRFWLVCRGGDVDLCLRPPGFDPDVTLRGETLSLVDVYLARRTLGDAIRSGMLEVEGSRSAIRDLPQWLRTTSFAQYAHRAPGGP